MKKTREKAFRLSVVAFSITLLLGIGALSPLQASLLQPRLSTRTDNILVKNVKGNTYYFKDANKNTLLDVYEDWRYPTALRVMDLLSRMSTEDKLGLMVIGSQSLGSTGCSSPSANGILCESYRQFTSNVFSAPGDSFEFFEKPVIERSAPSTEGILDWKVRFMIDRSNADPLTLAIWTNALQQVAERSEFGIPVVITSNPRNHNTNNVGFGLQESSGTFSLWPSTLGMGAAFIGEMETSKHKSNMIQDFAQLAAQEWDATGIRKIYGYMADTATDPRWFRLADTFGDSPEIVAEATRQIVSGFQGTPLSRTGIAMTTKHFPGGGARDRGTDPHYVYGQYSPYPTKDSLYKYHLPGFIAAVDAGTSSIMPYYARPNDAMSVPQLYLNNIPDADKTVNADGDGSTLFTRDKLGNRIYDMKYLAKKSPQKFLDKDVDEELGFAYSNKIIDRLLRDQLGFKGYINSDSGILTGMAWGLENASLAERIARGATNGVDVFGDMSDVFLFREAFDSEADFNQKVLNQAAGRLLAEMFQLGLFEDPYRDPQQAVDIFNEPERREAAYAAHQKSVVVLKNSGNLLPLTEEKIGQAPVYIEFFSRDGEDSRAADTLTLYQAIKREAPWLNVTFDIDKAAYALLFVKPADGVGLFEQTAEFVYNLQIDKHNGIDIDRINMIQAKVPTIVNVNLSQPWLLENLEPGSAAITASFATLSEAVVDVITGKVNPVGALPVTLPRNEGEVVKAETAGPQKNGKIIASDAPGYLRTNLKDYVYTDSNGEQYVTGFHLLWDINELDNSAPDSKALLQQAQRALLTTRWQQAQNRPSAARYYINANALEKRWMGQTDNNAAPLPDDAIIPLVKMLILEDDVNIILNQPALTNNGVDANLKTRNPARSMNPGLFVTEEDYRIVLNRYLNAAIYQTPENADKANVYSAGIWLDASADHNSLALKNSINFAYSDALSAYGVFQNASSQDNLLVLQDALNLAVGNGVAAHGIYHGNSNAYNLLTQEGYDSGLRQAFSQNAVIMDRAANIALRQKGDTITPDSAFTNAPGLVMNDSLVVGNITQTAGDDFLLSFNTLLQGSVNLSNGNDTFVLDENTRDFTLKGQITPDYLFTDNLYIYTPTCNDESCLQVKQNEGGFSILTHADGDNDDNNGKTIASISYGAINPFNVYQVSLDNKGALFQNQLLARDTPPLLRPLLKQYSYTFANGYQADFVLPASETVEILPLETTAPQVKNRAAVIAPDNRGKMLKVGQWLLTPDQVITPEGYQLRSDGLKVPAGTPLPGVVTGRMSQTIGNTLVLATDAKGNIQTQSFNEPNVTNPGSPLILKQDALLVRDIDKAATPDMLRIAINGPEMAVKTPEGIRASADINTLSLKSLSHVPGSALHIDALNYLLDVPLLLSDTQQTRERAMRLQGGEFDVYLNYLADNRTYDGGNGGQGSKGQTSGVALGLGAGLSDTMTLYGQLARTYGDVSSGGSSADVNMTSLALTLTFRPLADSNGGSTPFVALSGQMGWSQYEPTREMGILGKAHADSRGQMYTYAVTAGYEASLTPEWRLTPSLALRSTHLSQDDFQESAQQHAFDVSGLSTNSTDIALRLDSDYRFSMDDWQITPRLFAEYRHNLGDKDSQADLYLNGVSLDPVTHIRGDNLLRGGAELDIGYGNWSVALRADGTFGDKNSGGNIAALLGARF